MNKTNMNKSGGTMTSKLTKKAKDTKAFSIKLYSGKMVSEVREAIRKYIIKTIGRDPQDNFVVEDTKDGLLYITGCQRCRVNIATDWLRGTTKNMTLCGPCYFSPYTKKLAILSSHFQRGDE